MSQMNIRFRNTWRTAAPGGGNLKSSRFLKGESGVVRSLEVSPVLE